MYHTKSSYMDVTPEIVKLEIAILRQIPNSHLVYSVAHREGILQNQRLQFVLKETCIRDIESGTQTHNYIQTDV